jgi:hypothetical protein
MWERQRSRFRVLQMRGKVIPAARVTSDGEPEFPVTPAASL